MAGNKPDILMTHQRQNSTLLNRLTGPLSMALCAIIALTATLMYMHLSDAEQREAARLETIADSHAREVSGWLLHRMKETSFVHGSVLMADYYRQWESHGDAKSLRQLLERLTNYSKANEYHSALIINENNEVVARDTDLPQKHIGPELEVALKRARETGNVQRTEIYHRPGSPLPVRLDFVIPLVKASNPARGAVVLRADPADFLFPLMKSWPSPTKTGESVLVRREGDLIIHMNRVETGGHGGAMTANAGPSLLAVRATASDAALGHAIQAVDNRGNVIFGAAQRVAGSDWYVVTKINHSEVVSAAMPELIWTGIGGLILCIAAIAVAKYFRTRDELGAALAEQTAQAEKINALKLLELVTESSTDAIFAKDLRGRYLMVNDEVCRTTGKSREEIIGHDDIALFGHAIGEQVMARDAQAMREDRTVEFEEAVNSVSGPRIYHSTKGAIHDARGKVIGMYGISRDISERKRDEHALQESRAMLQTVQDSIQSQMAVLDCNGVIVAVNAAWQKFAAENASHTENAAPHSDIGINYLDVCSAARGPFSDEAEIVHAGLRAVLNGDLKTFSLEYPCHCPSANRWFMMNAMPMDRERGGAVVVHTDISERKRAEQLQREQNRVLEMIASEQPLDKTLEAITRGIETLADDILCSVLLIDDSGTRLLHGAGPSLPAEYNRAINGIAIGPGVGSCGSAAYAREEVIVEDILTHPYWRDFVALAAPLGLRACWSTPILDAQGRLLGTFAVYSRQPGAPTDWHRQLINVATHVTAISIGTAQARSALLGSEHKYRLMIGALTEGIVMFDAEGHVISANPAAERLFDMSEAEIIARWRDPAGSPKPIDENGNPVPYQDRAVARALTTGEPQRNVVHGRKLRDGSVRWNIINAEPIRAKPDGPVTAVIASFTDITQRHSAEQELRKLSLAVDQSFSSIIITDADARIEYVNEAFCRVSGYTRQELLGRNPRLLKSGKTPKASYVAMWEALVRGEAWKGEFTNRRKNGEEFTEVVHISPIRQANGRITHYLGIREDVTERKRVSEELDRHRHRLEELVAERTNALEKSNAALQQNEEFLKTITDNVPGLVSYWDADMRCRFANKAYAHWWGIAPEAMHGCTLQELLIAPKLDEYEPYFAAALRGEPQHMEREYHLANGEIGYTWAHYIPDIRDGKTVGFYVLATDITAIKMAELRLQQLNEQLTAARDKADAANTAKSAFLANMSHEIRTPMNAIIGLTHLLRRDSRNPTQQGRLSRVSDAAHHLLNIINDILDLSKIESGKLTLEASNFSLSTLLSRVAALIADRARAKGIEVIVDTDHLPETLCGDSTRLSQALLNLLGNAVKFTERGTVTLDAEILERQDDNLLARFTVRDTGIGIAPDRLGHLFNAFEQADASITRRFGGTGLGLAITRHIAALMGGEVGVESTPGSGSTFWFTARLQIAAAEDAPVKPLFNEQRVLIVDDLPLALTAISQMLQALGLRVDTAGTGVDALEKIRAADKAGTPYAAVLCDWRMPGMDGVEVARRMDSLGLAQMPGRVLITAFDNDAMWRQSRAAGFDAVMIKPLTRDILGETLGELLHTAAPETENAPLQVIEGKLRARARHAHPACRRQSGQPGSGRRAAQRRGHYAGCCRRRPAGPRNGQQPPL